MYVSEQQQQYVNIWISVHKRCIAGLVWYTICGQIAIFFSLPFIFGLKKAKIKQDFQVCIIKHTKCKSTINLVSRIFVSLCVHFFFSSLFYAASSFSLNMSKLSWCFCCKFRPIHTRPFSAIIRNQNNGLLNHNIHTIYASLGLETFTILNFTNLVYSIIFVQVNQVYILCIWDCLIWWILWKICVRISKWMRSKIYLFTYNEKAMPFACNVLAVN